MAKQHGKSTYLAHAHLNEAVGGTAFAAPATLYFGWYTTQPDTNGAGGVEASGGGYARVAVTNNATNFPAAASRRKQNAVAISWAPATQDQGLAVGWCAFDALTAGNLLYFGKLVGTFKVFTAAAATDLITSTAHGFADGDAVEVESEGGTVPAGLSENTKYYVRDSLANTFKLAATSGGAAIDLVE